MVGEPAAQPAITLESEAGTLPTGKRHSIRRLRNNVLVALAAAFVLEVVARLIHVYSDYHPLVGEAISMAALIVLCGSALYLIFWLRDSRTLTWCISLASFFLLLSHSINMAEDIVPGAAIFQGQLHNQIEALVLLGGLILMIATLYLALLETVAVKRALVDDRAELVNEIREREEAQEQLRKSQDKLRQLSAHMEQLRESERANVAREIHDELGQTLTSLKIDVATLRKQMPDAREFSLEIMRRMEEQLNGTMQVIRRIITELRPGVLDDLGLFPAIEWQLRDFEKRAGLACSIDLATEEPCWSKEKSTAIFRILQESLTNVARHARASRVDVRVGAENGSLNLLVCDDGQGFDASDIESRRSFGLLGMRERAAQFGGSVRVESSAGGGTTVVVRVPLENMDQEREGE